MLDIVNYLGEFFNEMKLNDIVNSLANRKACELRHAFYKIKKAKLYSQMIIKAYARLVFKISKAPDCSQPRAGVLTSWLKRQGGLSLNCAMTSSAALTSSSQHTRAEKD